MVFIMNFLPNLLSWAQIILSLLLVGAILLQQSEAGLGGTFGGASASNPFRTKRGFEKTMFVATMVIAVLFIASTILASYLKV